MERNDTPNWKGHVWVFLLLSRSLAEIKEQIHTVSLYGQLVRPDPSSKISDCRYISQADNSQATVFRQSYDTFIHPFSILSKQGVSKTVTSKLLNKISPT